MTRSPFGVACGGSTDMDYKFRIVSLDANALVCLCGQMNEVDKARLTHLLESVDKLKGKVLFPTPAVAEFLVQADQAALTILNTFQGKSSIVAAPLDLAAAFELSQMDAAAQSRGDKRDGSSREWQKIKVDRQLVAISKRFGAELIVSGDSDVRAAAARVGIQAMDISELAIPDEARQPHLSLTPAEDFHRAENVLSAEEPNPIEEAPMKGAGAQLPGPDA